MADEAAARAASEPPPDGTVANIEACNPIEIAPHAAHARTPPDRLGAIVEGVKRSGMSASIVRVSSAPTHRCLDEKEPGPRGRVPGSPWHAKRLRYSSSSFQ